jgi:hypothetical protein
MTQQSKQATNGKPQQIKTPLQKAYEACAFITSDASDKQVAEQIAQELVQYLQDNHVAVDTLENLHPAALALADIKALLEAEADSQGNLQHFRIPEQYLISESQRMTELLFRLTEYLENSLVQFIAVSDQSIFDSLNSSLLINVPNDLWRILRLALEHIRGALGWVRWDDMDKDNPLWYKSPLPKGEEIYTTRYRVITKDMLDDVMKLLLRIEGYMQPSLEAKPYYSSQKTAIDMAKDIRGKTYTTFELSELRRKYVSTNVKTKDVSLGHVIRDFHRTLEDYTTYAVVKREIERSKFLIPGYFEAYQKIKAWVDKLVDISYRHEYAQNRSRNQPDWSHEWDDLNAKASANGWASNLLKSLSEDILSGAFAPASQTEEDAETV